jgi:Rieske Fe-S protein
MSEMNRREFVVAAAAAAACACTFACGASEALAQAAATAPAGPVDVGPLAKFAKDGIDGTLAKTRKLAVVRQGDTLYAVSTVCSHKGKDVVVQGGQFVCPAHKSVFTAMGTVEKGPAKASLLRYGISVNEAGHVIVDPSKQFEEKDWEKTGAFVKVGK